MTMKVFPTEAIKHEDTSKIIHDYVYSQHEAVFLCKFTSKLTKHDFEKNIRVFLTTDVYKVFLLVMHIEGDCKKMLQYISHVRIVIEQLENEIQKEKKLFVVLLLLPPTQLLSSSYPCMFLRGWDLHYLDSISPEISTSRKPSKLKISDCFKQLCIPNASVDEPSISQSLITFFNDLLDDIIPVVVSRVSFGKDSDASINNMPGFMKTQIMTYLFKSIGEVLCSRFKQFWNVETMNRYIQMAALDIYSYHSTLSLADQMQVTFHFLFANFTVYLMNEVNTFNGLDMFYSLTNSSQGVVFASSSEDYRCLLSLLAEMLQYLPVPDISTISIYNDKGKSLSVFKNLFHNSHCKFPMSHTIFLVLKTIIDYSWQYLRNKHRSTRATITEEMIVMNGIEQWKEALQVC